MEIEICCNSVQSAINAHKAGATRVELCHDLEGGGVTPSYGAVAHCTYDLHLRTRVLFRPRRGNFVCTSEEYVCILDDIEMYRKRDIEAAVVGFLTPGGKIDLVHTFNIVHWSKGLEVTFHRAFDELSPEEAPEALEQLIECGCHKLLTSGCAPTALEGADTIRRLVEQARGRIGIIAAGGITPQNVREIIDRTGVQEVHASCKVMTPNGWETSAHQVEALLKAVNC